MAKRVLPLTETQVRNAKPASSDVKLFDGGGLFLLITPNGGRRWQFKYRFAGKEKKLSIGTYPSVSLSEARKRREEAREQIAKGNDPAALKRAEKVAVAIQQANTFETLANEWFRLKTKTLAAKTRNMAKTRLENDVFPKIGHLPVSEITAPMVLNGVLRPIEKRGSIDLTHRVKSMLSRIFRYGVATGACVRDVTFDLRGALEPIPRKHLPSITDPKKVGELLRAIDGFEGHYVVKCALRLHPLVVTRPSELRHAEWSEVDLESSTWSIPGARMKMRSNHIVPLSAQAVAILKDLHCLTGEGRYVFPSVKTVSKPISDNTLNSSLRRMGFGSDEVVSHGWRATFRTLADEILGFRVDFIEHQLAHAVKDPTGRAYNRTTHIIERRKMMQVWADYLDGLKVGGKVIPLKKPA